MIILYQTEVTCLKSKANGNVVIKHRTPSNGIKTNTITEYALPLGIRTNNVIVTHYYKPELVGSSL
jgi:hypothetical protein